MRACRGGQRGVCARARESVGAGARGVRGACDAGAAGGCARGGGGFVGGGAVAARSAAAFCAAMRRNHPGLSHNEREERALRGTWSVFCTPVDRFFLSSSAFFLGASHRSLAVLLARCSWSLASQRNIAWQLRSGGSSLLPSVRFETRNNKRLACLLSCSVRVGSE